MTELVSANRALNVDPDERFGLLHRGYLERRGWNARWVPDGRAVLGRIGASPPDVLITELDGDHLDGFEFLQRVHSKVPGLPLVVCSRQAAIQNWTDEECRALGISGVLARPVEFPRVAALLEQLVA